MSQGEIYTRLRQHGSAWLKSQVLYADRQLVVLNKPPGLICQINNSQDGNGINLNSYLRDIQQWLSSEPRPVHRLDKGTTGCLLVAANQAAARSISQQFRQHTVSKTYLALVRGTFQKSSGRISNHIKYLDGRGMLHKDGNPALTDWRLLASSSTAPLSLIQMNLITGNKHQLRMHLATCLNAPILGDPLYSRSAPPPAAHTPIEFAEDRMFLHASEISLFKYLRTGLRFRLELRAPLPSDFRRICQDFGMVIPPGLESAKLTIADTRLPDHPELNELRLWK